MMMIGQSMAGLEGLTCYENSGMYFPSSRAGWDTCRAPDFNTAFNDGVDLIAQCDQSHYGRLVALWPNLCETTASNIMKHAGYDGPAIKCYDNVSGWRTTLFNLSPHRPSKKQASSCVLALHQPIILPTPHRFSLLACHFSALQMVARVDCVTIKE